MPNGDNATLAAADPFPAPAGASAGEASAAAAEVIYELEHSFHLPNVLPTFALQASFSLHRRTTPTSGYGYGSGNGGNSNDDDHDDYFDDDDGTTYDDAYLPNLGGGYHHLNYSTFKGTLSDFGFYSGNDTDDFTSHLHPATDVDVEGVVAAMAFNSLVFAVLMLSYEVLRRAVPSVYAGKTHKAAKRGEGASSSGGLPDIEDMDLPLDWVMPVFGVPWAKVRKAGGLDAYMFLRYIRMCLRITSVSAFWGILALWPIYARGGGAYQEWHSWYHFSMANIDQGSWRIWPPTIFIYLFSCYVFFAMKQEYKHFVELRMEFLGKGGIRGARGVVERSSRQQTYSVMVERIPADLRSDRALFEYFDRLFPGRVHSASVVLNVPDLEELAARKLRVTRRLEKSIAYHEATGQRPTHIVGRPRINVLGIECSPLELPIGRAACHDTHDMTDESNAEHPPPKGTIVDSIEYYTQDLADLNHLLFAKQRRKAQIAETGNASHRAYNWITRAVDYAEAMAETIMDESLAENELTLGNEPTNSTATTSSSASDTFRGTLPTKERPTTHRSLYGSFDDDDDDTENPWDESFADDEGGSRGLSSWDHNLGGDPTEQQQQGQEEELSPRSASFIQERNSSKNLPPGGDWTPYGCQPKEVTFWRRLAGRLGLDFAVSGFRFCKKRLNVIVDNVVGITMSSTGFVSFTTHQTTMIAACAPLTHKPNALDVRMAPEPRDILWDNAYISKDITRGKEITANILLGFGAILWSIPLAAIQAFAKAEQLALIPGMEWVLTLDGGNLKAFINGYLPVVALLCLIMILPFVFEWIAVTYENRKTKSNIQESIVGRYFYYQVANIYITVTAGSIWKALADILDHPAEALEILGESIPMMVGYFMSFLITKILAGLPMLILRGGALSRMLLLRSCFSDRKLTQRELDEIYRPETIFYGWEYPTQLLVIMICFAYAVISPIILPFGALYFLGALMVYKKQVLYVYSPTYESGGKLFPIVCDRTLFGLICGQLTFIGYSLIRKGQWQPLFLSPLPFITLFMMGYFREHYATPGLKLSLERAIELDHVADVRASPKKGNPIPGSGANRLASKFSEDYYRQPVLTEEPGRPMPYRRKDGMDELTAEALSRLQGGVSRYQMMIDETRQGVVSGASHKASQSGLRNLRVCLSDSEGGGPSNSKENASSAEFEAPEQL